MSEHPFLSDLEQLLLISVLRVRDGAYSAAIQSDIAETTGRHVSVGSIYMTLGRLEERGLASSGMSEPTPERGGKARRTYRVTPAGREALEWNRGMMDRMWAGVPAGEGS